MYQTYQEQQALIKEREAALTAKLLTIEIDGWEAVDGKYSSVDFIHTLTGASFSIGTNLYCAKGDRIEAYANWPKNQAGEFMTLNDWGVIDYRSVEPYRIGFTFTKSVKNIISDLVHRLIPGMVEHQIAINAIINGQSASRLAIKCAADKIVGVTSYQYAHEAKGRVQDLSSCSAKVPFDGGCASVSKYRGAGSAEPTVDLTLADLSVDHALAILALLSS